MSIIYDALKKVEKTTEKNAPAGSEIRKFNKPKPVLIYILVILIGLYFGNTIFKKIAKPKTKPLATPTLIGIQAITPVNKTPAAPVQAEKTSTEPSLVLNGVFFENDKGYALINNQVLKIGDFIQNAKLEEISLEKVVLEFNGRKITISNGSR